MAIPSSLSRWLRFPGRVALIFGLGVLSTPGARADAPDQADRAAFGNLLIRSDGGSIYLSEGGLSEGGPGFQELRLRDTPEARHLRRLLQGRSRAEGNSVELNATTLASGGGAGFHWWWHPADKTESPAKPEKTDKAGTPKNPAVRGKADTDNAGGKD